jgi:DNA-binding NarL/FixJ family response regulator
MIRVLVADDHPIIRRGVRQIVDATDDIRVVGEAGRGSELTTMARAKSHDVVVLDLSMPETDGLDVLKEIVRERPDVPVLVLTLHAENQFAIRALKAGASGYLTKDAAPAELVTALRKVAAGRRYLSAAMAEQMAGHLAVDNGRLPHERLSDREFQVLRLIADGLSTREIASQLSLSMKTIATYRSRIFQKMDLGSPAELAAYVVRNGLLD